MKRRDFQELAALRLKEAKLLLKGGCPEGAYYLAGYAAECAFKACIAKRTERFDFPDLEIARGSWRHDLLELAITARIDEELRRARNQDAQFDTYWTVVKQWKPESRYERAAQVDAEDLIRALEDRKHGILQWLKHRW